MYLFTENKVDNSVIITPTINIEINRKIKFCWVTTPFNSGKNLYSSLMITSNPKMEDIIKNYNDYNVKVKIYTTEAYVCCDKIFRFNTKDKVFNHGDLLDELEKQDILEHYKKFINETLRQLKDEK